VKKDKKTEEKEIDGKRINNNKWLNEKKESSSGEQK